jgi:hypothetical protein
MKKRMTIALFLVLGISMFSHAKVFRNAYLAFELPDGWNCSLEATEWICRHLDSKMSKEALIIFTAKEAGPADSLAIYEQVINTTRSVADRSGKSSRSSVAIQAKQTRINDQVWVDGLQKGSEIPSYFTRYVVTIKDKIAVLVTFSAHTDFFVRYSAEFFKSVQSLRVIASKNLLAEAHTNASSTSGVWNATGPQDGSMNMSSVDAFGRKKPSKSNNLNLVLLAVGGIIAAAGAFFAMKSRRR